MRSTSALPEFLPPALRQVAHPLTCARGESLFHSGTPVDAVYFVLFGEVIALRHLPGGTEAVVQRARRGEFLALAAIAEAEFSCCARAVTESKLVRLPIAELKAALLLDAGFACELAILLALEVAHEHRCIERLCIQRSRDRVLHYLACEGPVMPRRIRLGNWARDLGLAPATLSRRLAELEAEGLIERQARIIRLSGAGEPPGACSCASAGRKAEPGKP